MIYYSASGYVFPCHCPLSLLLSEAAHGIFNEQNDLSAHCAHKGRIDKSAKKVYVEEMKNGLSLTGT